MLKFRLTEFFDKLILLIAMLVFLVVGVTGIRSARNLNAISAQQRSMLPEGKVDVELFNVAVSSPRKESWASPKGQSRGINWVFDAFTPPVIYYNPVSREFAITPPKLVASSSPEDPYRSFGLELIQVRPRPYRLQLVGYAGDTGNYMAYFEYRPTGQMLLAKSGKLLVEAGVKILSFDVRQMEVQQEGSMPVFEKVGIAHLLDYESNEELYLTNKETKIFSDLEAKVRAMEDGQVYVVREGSQVELQSSYYVIGELSANPEEAMVTRISRDGARRQSKLLTPPSLDSSLNRINRESEPTSPFAIRPKALFLEPKS